MFKYLFAIAFFFVNVSLYAVETEKAVLGTQSHNAYQNIHLDPAGTHAYFAHNEEYGTGVIFVCRLATGQIYPLSPITGPGGVTYNSYQPRLSPNGKFLIYMRNKKNSSTLIKQLVILDIQTHAEVIIDSSNSAHPYKEFNFSKYPWNPLSNAFTYTALQLNGEPQSYVAKAQYRKGTEWYQKILENTPTFTYKQSIWSPKGHRIAFLAQKSIPVIPVYPPQQKQYLNIISATNGAWVLSQDVSKDYPEYIKEIAWDLSEDYIYYTHYTSASSLHGGFEFGKLHINVFIPFLEDDYGKTVFEEFLPGFVSDGHISDFVIDYATGDIYLAREINDGSPDIEKQMETTQIIQIPFLNPLTFNDMSPVNLDNHIHEYLAFRTNSSLLSPGATGLFAYNKKKMGKKVLSYDAFGNPYFAYYPSLEFHQLTIFGDF